MKKSLVLISALLGAYGVTKLAGQQAALPAGPFTAAQAEEGRTAYTANCASCHNADLSGSGNAAPLAGGVFMGGWGNRTAADLVGFMAGAMPPNNPGSLTEAAYVTLPLTSCNITARVRAPGAHHVGQRRLRTWPAARLAHKSHKVAEADESRSRWRRPWRGGAAAEQAQRAAVVAQEAADVQQQQRRVGLTVAGTVKNYTPLTDAMMKNPDPSDWVILRHDYHANNYCTLNQITAGNVKDLQLQWVWAMPDGTNQNAPLVHNGVMFINNPTNIVQALDAKTGELIWENRIGQNATGSSQRGIALYQDKVYITTGDAHIYALDARTGKNVWDTVIGDRTGGSYSTSSGPLLAKGMVIQGLGGGQCDQYREEKCFISAYDAETGKLKWKFYTIAKKSDPGPEIKGPGPAPGDTWGSLADTFRAGGDTWITGSYDADLNLTYWGVAQAKPWMRASRQSGNGSTAYANSTVALDVDTGKLKWYFMHAPGETLDLDEVFERVLVDYQGQKLVFSAGKDVPSGSRNCCRDRSLRHRRFAASTPMPSPFLLQSAAPGGAERRRLWSVAQSKPTARAAKPRQRRATTPPNTRVGDARIIARAHVSQPTIPQPTRSPRVFQASFPERKWKNLRGTCPVHRDRRPLSLQTG